MWNCVLQGFVPPVTIVHRLHVRWHVVDAVRQVAEELADHVERLFLGFRQIVHDTALAHLHTFVAKFLLGDIDPECHFDHGRTTGEQYGGVLHHDAEVRQRGLYSG